jgi:F-type H+-transporting ATPase subunit epsilon
MANTYKLDILSPEGNVFSGEVSFATFPTMAGDITVLAGHTAIITKLSVGEVVIDINGEKKFITIAGGFLEFSDNVASVIADFAIRSEEIDDKKIEEAKKHAQEQMAKKDKISSAVMEHDLQKAILELKFFENIKSKNKRYKA